MAAQTNAAESEFLIVSNRLPVRRSTQDASGWKTSPGGLVSALAPLLRNRPCAWVGWTGEADDTPTSFEHDGIYNVPVEIRREEVDYYYAGFANRTVWPLYHDAVRPPVYRRRWWRSYQEVNWKFAEKAAEAAGEQAMVWVHDYHLQLVPQMMRKLRPELRIGFFLHIPFPPLELFAQMPWRMQIIEGLLGADVVGFQTFMGAQNFARLARRYAKAEGSRAALRHDGRRIYVDRFPISIDVDTYQAPASTPEVAADVREWQQRIGVDRKVILGVDRMDYTKGIDMRLRAYQEMLRAGAVEPHECVFIQVAVPSRGQVEEYQDLRSEVERLVGEINGEFGTLEHPVLYYFYKSFDLPKLVALYRLADVMLVTPFRDGMNLVAKEYVAARTDERGVLVLSEFTGAAHELREALLVNPHDLDGVAAALEQAVRMPEEEQTRRMRALRDVVLRHDVHRWAKAFIDVLSPHGQPVSAT